MLPSLLAGVRMLASTMLWNGDLPPAPPMSGALVSGCTFSVGPPGPPSPALCAAFTAHCTRFRDDLRSQHVHALKTSTPLQSKHDEDRDNPLRDVAFRTACTGGWTTASDATYLSAYTATCIVDGTDWIPFVFDDFLQSQFGKPDGSRAIHSDFIGCQVPAHA